LKGTNEVKKIGIPTVAGSMKVSEGETVDEMDKLINCQDASGFWSSQDTLLTYLSQS
jgi:hypothetical protein